MIKHVVYAFFLSCFVIASAKAAQGCPYASAINYADDAYQSSGGGKLWQSQKVKERDFIDRFIGAIFFPDKDDELNVGRMECAYLTGGGRRVTLRYVTQNVHERMLMESDYYWQSTVDLLGQAVHICQDSQPDNCKATPQNSTP
ncbi:MULTISPECIES: DUF3757 domain-containing protein [Pseudomonas]|uniref:DUF3757 domain-containing protein n=1 Tax=Pseudomonas azadiae TaxID=2843612 RepID=A0ABS6P1M0_9PSED|nr:MULTISPECIES: DUF3757 domain-containing protein [Pseudomonas]MBV4454343.1 DUF3757 domain-containing protein [Pseudomonas azadiae]NMF41140.1 DUF3757 domain-containing protein [Pseudomonas sp. SWRI 103]